MKLLIFLYLAFISGVMGGAIIGNELVKYDRQHWPITPSTVGDPHHKNEVTLTLNITREQV